ncbi:tetratricopeptide repeat protein [Rhodospirillum sp. A1_3_36]|uniref:tetratricopeptide repeat protein n=1 Tax=Rhodospirillum sp. A1_3_36 TaxID=3391666 RepID=UPI0039A504B1
MVRSSRFPTSIRLVLALCLALGVLTPAGSGWAWANEAAASKPSIDEDVPSLEITATKAVERGYRAMRAGALGEALEAYREALSIDPARVEAQLGAGAALEGMGRIREAAAAYDRAVRLRPGDGEIRAKLVDALGRLAPEAALGRLGELAAHHPADPAIPERIGLLLLLQNRPLAALGALERTASLAPSVPAHWHNLAVAADRAGQAEKAVAAYRRAVALARAEGKSPQGMDLAALSRRARWLEVQMEEKTQ